MTELATTPLAFALLLVWGGLVALDGTSLGQLMISRPLVAATVAGAIAGNPAGGAMLGLVLELLHLTVLPVGAARYPEGGPPAVAAGWAYAASQAPGFATLFLIVLFTLLWDWVSGRSVQKLRQINVRFAVPDGESPPAESLGRWQVAGLAMDFLRGVALVAAGAAAFTWAVDLAVWLRPHEAVARIGVGVVMAAAAAATLRLFGLARWKFFLAGAGAALLLVVAR